MLRAMLTFEQTKAIERALGTEAAVPIIEAIQSTDTRVMASLLAEVATKADVEKVRVEIADVRGDVKRLDLQIKLLIALAVLAVAMFSPNLAALLKLAK